MWAAATGKARLPTVARLTGGTTRRLVPAERSALRPGTSTVEVSDNMKTWTGLSVEESVRMTEDRDKWRKYVHGVANPRIEDA